MPPRDYDLVTFDCYGTLVDWRGGITAAFHTAAADDDVELSSERILELHAEVEPRVQAGSYRSYREVLDETALEIASRLGWRLSSDRAGFLADSLTGWKPFADTRPALERLIAAGYRLGILSNIDDELLEGTLRHLDVPFDLIVTAQQVRSYKPAHGHFLEARRRTGDTRWLHAAQSWFHDVVPSCELGIPVAWINRTAESPRPDARPDRELADLSGLADWLA